MIVSHGKKIASASKCFFNKEAIEKNSFFQEIVLKSHIPYTLLEDGKTTSHRFGELIGSFDPSVIAAGVATELGKHAFENIKEKVSNGKPKGDIFCSGDLDDISKSSLTTDAGALSTASSMALLSSVEDAVAEGVDDGKEVINEISNVALIDPSDLHVKAQLNPSVFFNSNANVISSALDSCNDILKSNVSSDTYDTLSKITSHVIDAKDSCVDFFSNVWNNDVTSFAGNIIDSASSNLDLTTVATAATLCLGAAALMKMQEKMSEHNLKNDNAFTFSVCRP